MKQPSYCLSIVFKKGDPYVLSRREPPATELLTLADTIAKYLGVMVRPVEESEAALKVFQQRFRKWEWLGLPLLFLFATLAGLVWWSILQQVGEWNAARFPEAVYFLGPNRWALAIPALFLGIGSAAPLIDAIDRLVLRDRHQEYTRYQKLRYGMSTKGFSLPFFMSVGIPCRGIKERCVYR